MNRLENRHDDGVLKSGRHGKWVYYLLGNQQHRRRYVVPKDPRTPGQLRARAAFGTASKAWSRSERLTADQRKAWRAAGAQIQSRPRLCQSGPLTGQQYFVRRNCIKERIGCEMLWEPLERAHRLDDRCLNGIAKVVLRRSAGSGPMWVEQGLANARLAKRPCWCGRKRPVSVSAIRLHRGLAEAGWPRHRRELWRGS